MFCNSHQQNEYCKTCNKHAETNESKKPKNGNIKDRLDKTDWRSPDGKTPTIYGNVMKKLNITREKADEEASKMDWIIPENEYEMKKKKAGRPKSPATSDTDDEKPKKKRGRPAKKEKKNYKVLYGGSVNPKNISELRKISSIKGFLVGGASQKAKNFIDIIKKTIN